MSGAIRMGFVRFAGAPIGRHSSRQGAGIRSCPHIRPVNVVRACADKSSTEVRSLRLLGGVGFIPHPEKVAKGGEDAFFYNKDAAGVFDGVGGWAKHGVDPGEYSQKLMMLTASELASGSDVADALDKAHVKNDKKGACTACVVKLTAKDDKDGGASLSVINVGDSGAMVLRKDKGICFRTKEQQHYFNCPYQLSSEMQDRVRDGTLQNTEVEEGDTILLATDGVLDNLYDDDIEFLFQTLSDRAEGELDPDEFAQSLAARARLLAAEERYVSPFTMSAAQQKLAALGGKEDDITAVACRVVRGKPDEEQVVSPRPKAKKAPKADEMPKAKL